MSGFSGKKASAISYLLQGWKIVDVAREVDISERQVYRWLEDGQFTDELKRQEGKVIDAVSWRLVSLARQAVDVLQEILDTPSPRAGDNIRRLAAVGVLDLLLKWRENVDIEQRLQALESVVQK